MMLPPHERISLAEWARACRVSQERARRTRRSPRRRLGRLEFISLLGWVVLSVCFAAAIRWLL